MASYYFLTGRQRRIELAGSYSYDAEFAYASGSPVLYIDHVGNRHWQYNVAWRKKPSVRVGFNDEFRISGPDISLVREASFGPAVFALDYEDGPVSSDPDYRDMVLVWGVWRGAAFGGVFEERGRVTIPFGGHFYVTFDRLDESPSLPDTIVSFSDSGDYSVFADVEEAFSFPNPLYSAAPDSVKYNIDYAKYVSLLSDNDADGNVSTIEEEPWRDVRFVETLRPGGQMGVTTSHTSQITAITTREIISDYYSPYVAAATTASKQSYISSPDVTANIFCSATWTGGGATWTPKEGSVSHSSGRAYVDQDSGWVTQTASGFSSILISDYFEIPRRYQITAHLHHMDTVAEEEPAVTVEVLKDGYIATSPTMISDTLTGGGHLTTTLTQDMGLTLLYATVDGAIESTSSPLYEPYTYAPNVSFPVSCGLRLTAASADARRAYYRRFLWHGHRWTPLKVWQDAQRFIIGPSHNLGTTGLDAGWYWSSFSGNGQVQALAASGGNPARVRIEWYSYASAESVWKKGAYLLQPNVLEYRRFRIKVRSIGSANRQFRIRYAPTNDGFTGPALGGRYWIVRTGGDGEWVERDLDIYWSMPIEGSVWPPSSGVTSFIPAANLNRWYVDSLTNGDVIEIAHLEGIREHRSLVTSLAGGIGCVTDGFPSGGGGGTMISAIPGGKPSATAQDYGWKRNLLTPAPVDQPYLFSPPDGVSNVYLDASTYLFNTDAPPIWLQGGGMLRHEYEEGEPEIDNGCLLDEPTGTSEAAGLDVKAEMISEVVQVYPGAGDVGQGGAYGITIPLWYGLQIRSQVIGAVITEDGGDPADAGTVRVEEIDTDGDSQGQRGEATPNSQDGWFATGAEFMKHLPLGLTDLTTDDNQHRAYLDNPDIPPADQLDFTLPQTRDLYRYRLLFFAPTKSWVVLATHSARSLFTEARNSNVWAVRHTADGVLLRESDEHDAYKKFTAAAIDPRRGTLIATAKRATPTTSATWGVWRSEDLGLTGDQTMTLSDDVTSTCVIHDTARGIFVLITVVENEDVFVYHDDKGDGDFGFPLPCYDQTASLMKGDVQALTYDERSGRIRGVFKAGGILRTYVSQDIGRTWTFES